MIPTSSNERQENFHVDGNSDTSNNIQSKLLNSFQVLIKNDRYFDDQVISSFKKIPQFTAPPLQELTTSMEVVHCYCISDMHADADKNQQWIEEYCVPVPTTSVFNVLIVPGDVGTDIEKIVKVFKHLSSAYDLVCYIPGNHETWTPLSSTQDKSTITTNYTSVNKIMDIYTALSQFPNVVCGPLRLKYASNERTLVLLPLHAWYHASWDKEPAITNPLYLRAQRVAPFRNLWMDYRRCHWPKDIICDDAFIYDPERGFHPQDAVLAEAFSSFNEPYLRSPPTKSIFSWTNDIDCTSTFFGTNLTTPSSECIHGNRTTVFSYSHYLPRQELLPEKRFLLEPLLATVVGSDILESQIRRLQPNLHIFGHTHIPIDLTIEGLRYLQWPLGYAREADKQCAPIKQHGPLLIFDSVLGDGDTGIPSVLPTLNLDVSKRYSKPNGRDPNNTTDLAEWVIKRMESLASMAST